MDISEEVTVKKFLAFILDGAESMMAGLVEKAGHAREGMSLNSLDRLSERLQMSVVLWKSLRLGGIDHVKTENQRKSFFLEG